MTKKVKFIQLSEKQPACTAAPIRYRNRAIPFFYKKEGHQTAAFVYLQSTNTIKQSIVIYIFALFLIR